MKIQELKFSDCKIGTTFATDTGSWLVLDKGERTVIAISQEEALKAKVSGCYAWDELLVYATIFDLFDFGG